MQLICVIYHIKVAGKGRQIQISNAFPTMCREKRKGTPTPALTALK
jgi:hypothetical protein